MADDNRQVLVLRRIPVHHAESARRNAAMSESDAWVIPAVFRLDIGASDLLIAEFVIGLLPPAGEPGWEYPGSSDADEADLDIVEAELSLTLAQEDDSRASMWLVHLSAARVRRDLGVTGPMLHGQVETLRIHVETLLDALQHTTREINAKVRKAAFPSGGPNARH